MVAFTVKNFGGEVPRQDNRQLPNDMSSLAVNCDLHSGRIEGFPQPEFIVDLTSAAPWEVRKAWRLPASLDGSGADTWLPLPSEFSSVVPSPLTNDTSKRFYWTNPPGSPEAGAWWNTLARIQAGGTNQTTGGANAPYNMGFIAPPLTPLSVSASGGTGPPPPSVDRSYIYTFIDTYNGESSPNQPSAVVAGQSDGTWSISGFPATAPGSPTGFAYAPVAHMRLYRTVSGSTTGANFYFVADIPFGTGTYTDTTLDTAITGNNTLTTASALPPPPGLDGLIEYPGGMLMGFSGNTLHFCEPDLPNSWPAPYDVSFFYPIVGLAIWQANLVVLTQGYPSNGTGTTPSGFTFSQLRVPEPCIARGSIITDLAGVYYASQNGLVMLNYFGMQNQTLSNMTKNVWLNEYQAAHIIACRHRAQYLAINGTDSGFIIDYSEARMGIVHITPIISCVSVWNDVYTGDAYMIGNSTVWRWDSPTTGPLIYKWRSKEFYLPAPSSLGACQISADPSIAQPHLVPTGPNPPPMAPSDLDLPAGVNAQFTLYAGPSALVGSNPGPMFRVMVKNLTNPREIFRLPSGFKAFNWFFEVLATVPVYSVEIASTMRELKKV